MQTVSTSNGKAPARERLGLRLLLLFVGTFLGVLLVIVVWTLFTNLVEGRRAADEAEIQAPAFVIDPKIETDLAKAMSFDAVPASVEVQNPFVDRAQIGTNITVTRTAATNTAASTSSSAAPVKASTTRVGGAGGMRSVGPNLIAPEVDNTKERYQDWLDRARAGNVMEPESETLGVDDLVPVGYAEGGDRGAEVILFSISLCRTFSFPVGTHFYNGILSEINTGEVVFAVQNGIRRKSYAVEHPCSGNTPVGAGDQD